MPFVTNTPESLIRRADSKNPASTCRGITTSGRPCRRPIAAPATKTANTPREPPYCWQHKDQAAGSPDPAPARLAHRSSLETLAERLNLVDLGKDEPKPAKKHRRTTQGGRSARPSTAPAVGGGSASRPAADKKRKPKRTRFALYFCAEVPLDPPERYAARPAAPARRQPQPQHATASPSASVAAAAAAKSSPRPSAASQTARLKGLIPDDLDVSAASQLLAELAKPLDKSEGPGYIYMYWLAAAGAPQSSSDAARDMLAPPSRSRRPSDAVAPYAEPARRPRARGTMILKIGRSDNVQRRMNQWRNQCGRDVTVLRYYPYSPSASGATAAPRMTPHANRVEQLIKTELAGRGMRADMGKCAACGRGHREWFNVEASRTAVRLVDGVIRRWVEWDEASN